MGYVEPMHFLLLLAACTGSQDPDWTLTWGDPTAPYEDENGVYQGPTFLDQIYLDCPFEEEVWQYGAYTVGWATSVTVVAHNGYPEQQETHALAAVERGPDNQWDHYYSELPIDLDAEPLESTAFTCDFTYVTWRFSVTDTSGALSDCVVFGHDPGRLDPTRRCRLFE